MSTYYIGYSTDSEIRYRASSGGVGSTVIKYLLENKHFGTSMTFVFNKIACRYEPKIIHDFADYNNCGSIYQDTDTIPFIKNNLQNIRNGIVVTCMPCQVKPIRSILDRCNIKHFILSLCCSGQTTVEGTWLLYSLLGIRKEDVDNIQYRGNGWPSGIQIRLNSGEIIKRENYSYPWNIIHQSLLFRPKRCLNCTIKTSPDADISLADPWLKEYLQTDSIGNSVIICNEIGESVIQQMINMHFLNLKTVDESVYISSQLGTIQTKAQANRFKAYNRIVGRMSLDKSFYKKRVTSSDKLLRFHIRVLKFLHRFLAKS